MIPFVVCALLQLLGTVMAGTFTIENDNFLLNGEEFKIFSGSVHYFRIHPDYWVDRLTRARSMGLNTIQFVIPWNIHNPSHGVYNFTGGADVVKYIQIAQSLDLLVMLRPGPYICAEHDFGGFPAWLFNINPQITFRTYETGYIEQVNIWWGVLLPLIQPLLIQNGGNVIMVQMENEFGSYGDVLTNPNDMNYMLHLITLARQYLGNETILYTTDGGDLSYMQRGSINGSAVYTCGDFGPGDNPETSFQAQKQMNPIGQSPNLCTEYYTGWLSHWGEAMANTSTAEMMQTLEQIWKDNGSVNLYMGHGGTSFGFYAGANGAGGTSYEPTITSYDYDSPISEGGEHGFSSSGDKYTELQSFFLSHPQSGSPTPATEPPLPPRSAFGNVTFTKYGNFMTNYYIIASAIFVDQNSTYPMEYYQQNFGIIVYSTTFSSISTNNYSLSINDVADRAIIFVDGEFIGFYYRVDPKDISVLLSSGSTLKIVVEAMGRINYGYFGDRKGINGKVMLNNVEIQSNSWTVATFPLEQQQLNNIIFQQQQQQQIPAFYEGNFNVSSIADTFLLLSGWGKGIAWINGVNIGRYWQTQTTQLTLFVPAPILVLGENTLMILELESINVSMQAEFVGQPVFSQSPSPNPPQYRKYH